MTEPLTVSIVGCARCHGDGHEGLAFEELTHPVVVEHERDLDEVVGSHWAPCPANGQPILLVFRDKA